MSENGWINTMEDGTKTIAIEDICADLDAIEEEMNEKDRRIANLERQLGWVSVNDALPGNNSKVWIYIPKYKEQSRGYYEADAGDGVWYTEENGVVEVTFWRELLEDPKE